MIQKMTGCILLVAWCSPVIARADSMDVFVSIPPLAYLVEQVGGDQVKVHVLVEKGQEPHTFEPLPRQMATLARATLFFKVGFPFEEELVRRIQAGSKKLTVVDMAQGVARLKMPCTCSRGAGRHHAHDHEEPDPHVWLSPPALKIMATNTAEALKRIDVAYAARYDLNLAALVEEIDQTHEKIREKLAPYAGESFYIFHPALGYFAEVYGLKQVAIETGGKSPTPRQLRAIIKQARADGARILFVEPQFDRRGAQVVARAIGGKLETIDPLASDVLANLETLAEKIADALRKK